MIQNKYIEENSILINNIFEDILFKQMRYCTKNYDNLSRLELFITSECNFKCEYCYLYKYSNDLYPDDKLNHDLIKNNLILVLNWIRKKQLNPDILELFSGEIWHTKFGLDILEILYEFSFDTYIISNKIFIPSNMSFIIDQEQTDKIQTIINKFKNIGVDLVFSASIDGKYIETDTRSFKDATLNINRDDDYYSKLFRFCKKNDYGFHPMISAYRIEEWKNNYLWFEDMFKKYELGKIKLMMLEVRNNEWNKNKIESYIDFISWLFNHLFTNIEPLIAEFYTNKTNASYNILKLYNNSMSLNCGIQNRLTIRLGDLSIIGCHRLGYEKLILGRLEVEHNALKLDIKGINPELALVIYGGNPSAFNLKCNKCAYNKLCFKQCLGAQYETNSEPFACCDTVCDLYKAKTDKLIELYCNYGFLDIAKNTPNKEILVIYSSIIEYLDKTKE